MFQYQFDKRVYAMSTEKQVVDVDDDGGMRKGIRRLIRNTFPTVEVVDFQEGAMALKYIEKTQPDLILVDILMPKMNGITLLSKLKKHTNWLVKSVPVIMLTGVGNKELDIEARKLGALDYVIKPINTQIFLLKLKRILHIDKIQQKSR